MRGSNNEIDYKDGLRVERNVSTPIYLDSFAAEQARLLESKSNLISDTLAEDRVALPQGMPVKSEPGLNTKGACLDAPPAKRIKLSRESSSDLFISPEPTMAHGHAEVNTPYNVERSAVKHEPQPANEIIDLDALPDIEIKLEKKLLIIEPENEYTELQMMEAEERKLAKEIEEAERLADMKQ